MKKVFINGLSAKIGGGKQILHSLSKNILKHGKNEKINYIILVPSKCDFADFDNDKIKFIDFPTLIGKTIFVPIISVFLIPFLIKKYNCDTLFNLGDLPIRTSRKQIMLFDWSYAIYNNKIIWDRMSMSEFIKRKTKLFFFKIMLSYVDIMLAQTKVSKKRLKKFYNLQSIQLFPNCIAMDNYKYKKSKDDKKLSKNYNLLCLSAYYPHKNLEIFIKLGKLIKKNRDKIKIFITIDGAKDPRAKLF